jgi:hypothetical protein
MKPHWLNNSIRFCCWRDLRYTFNDGFELNKFFGWNLLTRNHSPICDDDVNHSNITRRLQIKYKNHWQSYFKGSTLAIDEDKTNWQVLHILVKGIRPFFYSIFISIIRDVPRPRVSVGPDLGQFFFEVTKINIDPNRHRPRPRRPRGSGSVHPYLLSIKFEIFKIIVTNHP